MQAGESQANPAQPGTVWRKFGRDFLFHPLASIHAGDRMEHFARWRCPTGTTVLSGQHELVELNLLFDNSVSDFYQFKDWIRVLCNAEINSRVFVNTRLYCQFVDRPSGLETNWSQTLYLAHFLKALYFPPGFGAVGKVNGYTKLKGLILAQNERWRHGLGMQVEREILV